MLIHYDSLRLATPRYGSPWLATIRFVSGERLIQLIHWLAKVFGVSASPRRHLTSHVRCDVAYHGTAQSHLTDGVCHFALAPATRGISIACVGHLAREPEPRPLTWDGVWVTWHA